MLKLFGGKVLGWIGVVGGIAAVIVERRHVVGDAVADAASLVAVILAGIGGSIFGGKKAE